MGEVVSITQENIERIRVVTQGQFQFSKEEIERFKYVDAVLWVLLIQYHTILVEREKQPAT